MSCRRSSSFPLPPGCWLWHERSQIETLTARHMPEEDNIIEENCSSRRLHSCPLLGSLLIFEGCDNSEDFPHEETATQDVLPLYAKDIRKTGAIEATNSKDNSATSSISSDGSFAVHIKQSPQLHTPTSACFASEKFAECIPQRAYRRRMIEAGQRRVRCQEDTPHLDVKLSSSEESSTITSDKLCEQYDSGARKTTNQYHMESLQEKDYSCTSFLREDLFMEFGEFPTLGHPASRAKGSIPFTDDNLGIDEFEGDTLMRCELLGVMKPPCLQSTDDGGSMRCDYKTHGCLSPSYSSISTSPNTPMSLSNVTRCAPEDECKDENGRFVLACESSDDSSWTFSDSYLSSPSSPCTHPFGASVEPFPLIDPSSGCLPGCSVCITTFSFGGSLDPAVPSLGSGRILDVSASVGSSSMLKTSEPIVSSDLPRDMPCTPRVPPSRRVNSLDSLPLAPSGQPSGPTFIVYLEPSRNGSAVRDFLTSTALEVVEAFGADSTHCYPPHCSLTSFFDADELELQRIADVLEGLVAKIKIKANTRKQIRISRSNCCCSTNDTLMPNPHVDLSRIGNAYHYDTSHVQSSDIEYSLSTLTMTDCNDTPSDEGECGDHKVVYNRLSTFADSTASTTIINEEDFCTQTLTSAIDSTEILINEEGKENGDINQGQKSNGCHEVHQNEQFFYDVDVFSTEEKNPNDYFGNKPCVICSDDGYVVIPLRCPTIKELIDKLAKDVAHTCGLKIKPKRADHITLASMRDNHTQKCIAQLYETQLADLLEAECTWDVVIYELTRKSSDYYSEGTHVFSEYRRFEKIGKILPSLSSS